MLTNCQASITQSELFLPLSDNEGNDDRYALWINMQEDPLALVRRWAQYAVLDGTLDHGLGGVVEGTGPTRIWDYSLSERLAAVRHGNGREWWVVSQKGTTTTTKLSIALMGLHGVLDTFSYDFGIELGFGGESVFSPDGVWYAIASGFGMPKDSTKVLLFSVDRCTGQFALRHVWGPQETGTWFYGLAFSPDSRKLYVGTAESKSRLYQLTWDQSGVSSTQLAAVSGGYHLTDYGQLELGPDGKIYIAQFGSVPNSFSTYLGVIDFPNEEGLACNYRQQGLSLEGYYMRGYALPNLANYDLGPWEGSPCDTLPRPVSSGLAEIDDHSVSTLFPNPTSGTLYVTLPWQSEQINIYDLQGRNVLSSYPGAAKELVINLGALPEGLYILQAISPTGAQWSERFVFQGSP
jgi:WD40 repeat protein